MNYSQIRHLDTTDGPGLRVALYLSGCTIRCKGCHNYEAWDFNSGEELDEILINEIIEEVKKPYCSGLSLLGGEPFEKQRIEETIDLLRKVSEAAPDKDIWCWSGRLLEDIQADPDYSRMLEYIDYLVDGPFIEEHRDLNLKYMGSSNQRIHNLKEKKL